MRRGHGHNRVRLAFPNVFAVIGTSNVINVVRKLDAVSMQLYIGHVAELHLRMFKHNQTTADDRREAETRTVIYKARS